MTEESLESVCAQQITKIVDGFKEWSFFERDFSSLAIQLIYYSFMIYGDDYAKLEQVIQDIISHVFTPFRH